MGKKVRKDISLGKETFISLKGIEDSKKYAELLIEEAIEIISIFGKNSDILIKICRMIMKRSKWATKKLLWKKDITILG